MKSFDELPLVEPLGLRCNWGEFGEDDEVGTINLLTPERALRALQGVRSGTVINLTLPLDLPDPPLFGRQAFRHTIFSKRPRNQDDYVDGFYLQGSSQWDGLRHHRAREFGFYNGVGGEDAGPEGTKLGVGRWVEHGIVGRGVLLDIAAFRAASGRDSSPFDSWSISAAELQEVADWERVTFEPGDMLLIRTGWMAGYLAADAPKREELGDPDYRTWPGLAAD